MIFLDSSYLIALIINKDTHHKKSKTLKPVLSNEIKVINNTVLVEVLNSLKKTNHKTDLNSIIDTLLKIDNIHFLNDKDYAKSIELYKYYNQSLNFSDCTILCTMLKNNISNIVSFDSDFDKIKNIQRIYI